LVMNLCGESAFASSLADALEDDELALEVLD
jgi:hypothetical protein